MLATASSVCAQAASDLRFSNPERVKVHGLPPGAGGTALSTEEPFVSRDGRFLFFNSGQDEGNKDLHYARWNESDWIYVGEIGPGINEPLNVQGNPSMDAEGTFFFVESSVEPMIRVGRFSSDTGRVEGVADLDGVPKKRVRLVAQRLHGNMGVEVSADGDLVFFSRATFKLKGIAFGGIHASDLLFSRKQSSRKQDDRFVYDEGEAHRVMARINTDDLEYAASISKDELVLYFTRLPRAALIAGKPRSAILRAERTSPTAPFAEPRIIEAIGTSDFVEGPAISPDGRALYYHKREGGKFRLYRVTRGLPYLQPHDR